MRMPSPRRALAAIVLVFCLGSAALAGGSGGPQDPFAGGPRGPQDPTAKVTNITVGKARREHPNPPGWRWAAPTQDFGPGRRWGATTPEVVVTGYSVVDRDGRLRIFAVVTGAGLVDADCRVVLFDAAGKRYSPRREDSGVEVGRDAEVLSQVYALDPAVLAPEKVAAIGVERVIRPLGR